MNVGNGHASTAPFLEQFPGCWLLCPETTEVYGVWQKLPHHKLLSHGE